MKKFLLTIAALFVISFANAQTDSSRKPAAKEATVTITEADKAKVRDDIKKRREQNKIEMDKARKVVKERISADTIRKK